MIQYCCYEIKDFDILSSKLEDLQTNDWSVDVTPIFNEKGVITLYFVFCKRIKPKEKVTLPSKQINSVAQLDSFFK
jgi:hypothetical protein